jgi:allantoinase
MQASRTGPKPRNDPRTNRRRTRRGFFDYVIGHDGVALMTASEIGDWYRAEMSKL